MKPSDSDREAIVQYINRFENIGDTLIREKVKMYKKLLKDSGPPEPPPMRRGDGGFEPLRRKR